MTIDRFVMTVSPDFPAKHIAGWYILNAWLQNALGDHVHLELYPGFQEMKRAINTDQVDLIYVNPYDAAMLVRDKGFIPVARAEDMTDECVVAVHHEFYVQQVEELDQGTRVAATTDPVINMLGMLLLEPADLHRSAVEMVYSPNYQVVAKYLLRGEADAGFFQASAFDDLSRVVRDQLRPLVRSQIGDIHHLLLISPRLASRHDLIARTLVHMQADPKGADVLHDLGFTAWVEIGREDAECMIDLMDALRA